MSAGNGAAALHERARRDTNPDFEETLVEDLVLRRLIQSAVRHHMRTATLIALLTLATVIAFGVAILVFNS